MFRGPTIVPSSRVHLEPKCFTMFKCSNPASLSVLDMFLWGDDVLNCHWLVLGHQKSQVVALSLFSRLALEPKFKRQLAPCLGDFAKKDGGVEGFNGDSMGDIVVCSDIM